MFDLNIIVYLQDFNRQILESITFENAKKHLERSNHSELKKTFAFSVNKSSVRVNLNKEFKFVYGDWRVMLNESRIMPKNFFNLILTSETIYNSQNYAHLLNLFRECLLLDATNKSLILLSAKTYYFGCGGNLHEFLNLVKSNHYRFNASKNLLYDQIISNQSYPLNVSQIPANSSIASSSDLICNRSKVADFSQNCSTSSSDAAKNTQSNEADLYTSNISKEIVKIYFRN